MVLVDTSVWVDHFRRGNTALVALLNGMRVATHPYVIGELSCGGITNRRQVLAFLQDLPSTVLAEHAEVLRFIEDHRLNDRGLGWMDVHLLASAALSQCQLWTLDKSLTTAAVQLGVNHE